MASINMFAEDKDYLIEPLWRGHTEEFRPDNFASALIHFSKFKIFGMATLEWTSLAKHEDVYDKVCICSKRIQHAYYIKNRDNGNILRMCVSCIRNYLPKVLSQYVNKIENKRKAEAPPQIIEDRWCPGCNEHVITNKTELCSSCSKGRTCMKCGLKLIKVDSPPWMKYCIGCYRITKQSQDGLTCTNCKTKLFAPEEMRRKTLCEPCFRKSSSPSAGEEEGEQKKQCQRCYQFNIDPDNWRKWCEACSK